MNDRDLNCECAVETPTLLWELWERVWYIFENVLRLQNNNDRLQVFVSWTTFPLAKSWDKPDEYEYCLAWIINKLDAINQFFYKENQKYEELLYKLK